MKRVLPAYHETTPKPTNPNVRVKAASLGLDPSAAAPVLAPLTELGCVGPFPSLPWPSPPLGSPFPNSLKRKPDPLS